MQTLASILAGLPSDPTQVSPGLSPLLTQNMLAQQMGPAQLGGGTMAQGIPGQPGMPQGMSGQYPGLPHSMLGSLGATALPSGY